MDVGVGWGVVDGPWVVESTVGGAVVFSVVGVSTFVVGGFCSVVDCVLLSRLSRVTRLVGPGAACAIAMLKPRQSSTEARMNIDRDVFMVFFLSEEEVVVECDVSVPSLARVEDQEERELVNLSR